MSVSLVTACKNREEGLKAVLPSWLCLKEVNEIIIVSFMYRILLKKKGKHIYEV